MATKTREDQLSERLRGNVDMDADVRVNVRVKGEFRPHGLSLFCSDCTRIQAEKAAAESGPRAKCSQHSGSTPADSRQISWSHKEIRRCLSLLFLLHLLATPTLATPLLQPTIKRHHQAAKPKWVNPCGIDTSGIKRIQNVFHRHYEVTPMSDAELMENVILAAKNALSHTKYFKDDYVKKTFHTPTWWEHHETWKDMRYDWLPTWEEIPKHLHQRTSSKHLQELQVDVSLRNVYTYLQKLAVGLEQVVLDQNFYNGPFMEEFNEAEFKLKAVLCELQVAMLEKGITHDDKPVPRSIMTQDVRDIQESSYRNLRDWYIFRDYMNGLEYVLHSFGYLKKAGPSPPSAAARRSHGRRA